VLGSAVSIAVGAQEHIESRQQAIALFAGLMIGALCGGVSLA
jgi:hypothetical protein